MTRRAASKPAQAPRSAPFTRPRPVRISWWARLSRSPGGARLRTRIRRRSTILICTLVVAPLLVGGVAELIVRSVIEHRIEHSVAKSLGPDADVDISGSALVGLMTKHLDHVTITSDDARLGKMPGASIKAQLNDVRIGGGSGGATVASTHAEIGLTSDDIMNMVTSSAGRLPVSSVTADQASGTVQLGVGGGMARIDLRPELTKGRVEFTVAGAQIMGRPAPEATLDKLKNSFGNAGTKDDAPYPLALRATGVAVTESGVRITLDGGRTELKAK